MKASETKTDKTYKGKSLRDIRERLALYVIFLSSIVLLHAQTAGTVDITESSILPGANLTLTVDDTDLDTDGGSMQTVTVTVENTTTNETEDVVLTETGNNTGVFTNTLATIFGTSAGTNDDGTLVVQNGETAEVTYNDALTGAGGSGSVTDNASVTGGTDGTVNITETSILPGANLTLTVDDTDLDTDGGSMQTVTVTVENTTTNETEDVVLTETGNNTGVFTNTLATIFGTSAGTNDDGTLVVQNGETAEVTYNDALTGAGGSGSVTDNASVTGGTDGTVNITETSILPGANLTLTVDDTDLDTDGGSMQTVTVTVENTTTNETEDVVLTETGNNTGVFTNILATIFGTSAGTNDDGTLVVQNGETVEVTYNDALQSGGGSGSVTDNASVIGGTDGTIALSTPIAVGDNIVVTVNDADLDTDGGSMQSVTVIVINVTSGESESVLLTETGNNTGVFTNSITTSLGTGGTNDDGNLEFSGGEIARGSYSDVLLASGGSGSVTDDETVLIIITSIERAETNPTNDTEVDFTVTFSNTLSTGPIAGDFTISTTGSITGESISGISGTGPYTVSVNTGTGDGTVRLDLIDGTTNLVPNVQAPFNTGEVYDIDKTRPTIVGSTLDGSNAFIDIDFSEDVFNNAGAALVPGNWDITRVGGNPITVTVTDLTQTGGGALTGGEDPIRFELNQSGASAGTEDISIFPLNGTSVRDEAGNFMLITQSADETLNPVATLSFTTSVNADNTVLTVDFSEGVARNSALNQPVRYASNGEIFFLSFNDPDGSISGTNSGNISLGSSTAGNDIVTIDISTFITGGTASGDEILTLEKRDSDQIYGTVTVPSPLLPNSPEFVFTLSDELAPTASTPLSTPQTLRGGVASTSTVESNENGNVYLFLSTQPDPTSQSEIDALVLANNAFLGGAVTAGNPITVTPGASLNDGLYDVVAVDAAGNVSSAVGGWLTVDNTDPVFDPVNSSPTNGAVDVLVGSNIVLDFSEDVFPGASGTITLKLNSGADIQTFDITLAGNTTSPVAGAVGYDADKIYINPTSNLVGGPTAYSIRFTADVVIDVAGNGVAAVTDDATYTFTSEDLTPPTFTSGTTANFFENATGTVYTAAATDLSTPVSYSITGGADETDFSINGSGEVTFNSIPDHENPDDADLNNVYVIEVTATDNSSNLNTNAQTVTITVDNVNEEPTLTATNNNTSFEEGSVTPVSLYSVTDVNTIDGDNVIAFTIAVTNVTDGASAGQDEVLEVDGLSIPLQLTGLQDNATTPGAILTTLDYEVTRTGNTSFFNASDFSITELAFENLIDGITYINNSASVTNGTREAVITTVQDAGGVLNGGDDTNDMINDTTRVSVIAPPPAPRLSPGDIVIIGLHGDDEDEFTWVPLVDLLEDEVIYFTTQGYQDGLGELTTDTDNDDNASLIRFTTPSGGITKGTRMTLNDESSDPYPSENEAPYQLVTAFFANNTDFGIFGNGDQVLAFQSSDDITVPATFTRGGSGDSFVPIFAATQNSDNWNFASGGQADNTSDLYPGLVDNSTAIARGSGTDTDDEIDNIRYDGSTFTGTRANVLAAVGSDTNWEEDNSNTNNGGWTRGNPVTAFILNEIPAFDAITGSNPTYTEGDGGVSTSIFSGVDINNSNISAITETDQDITELRFTIQNIADGALEFLVVDGTSIPLNANVSNTTGGANPTDYDVAISSGTATVILDNFTNALPSDIETLIEGINYLNTDQDPTTGARLFTITSLTDINGGVTATNSPLSITSSVDVRNVNDEPTFSTEGLTNLFTEGDGSPGVLLFDNTASDAIEAADEFIAFDIRLTNSFDGASEFIRVNDFDIDLSNGNLGNSPAAPSFDFAVAVDGSNVATVSISNLAGGAGITSTVLNTIVDGIRYYNTATPPNGLSKSGTILNVQDNGGTALPGGDDLLENPTTSPVATVNIAILPPNITIAEWLDNDADGNLDQLRLTFDEAVDFFDNDGLDGAGLDVFDITIDNSGIDYNDAAFQGVTTVTLDLATPIAGTSIPATTLSYTSVGSIPPGNSRILRAGTAVEVQNGEVVTNGGMYVDGAAPLTSSITRQNPTGQDTNVDVLIFRVTFNEDILESSVDVADFGISGVTGPTVSISTLSTGVGDRAEFDIEVSGGDLAALNSAVGLNIAGGVTITDVAGNSLPTGDPATDETYLVDNIPPSLTAIDLDASTDTGISDTDNITNETAPTIIFTAENLSTVEIDWDDGSGFVAALTSPSDGTSQNETLGTPYASDGSDDGAKTIQVRVTDPAGNTTTNDITITLDTTPAAVITNGISVDDTQIIETDLTITVTVVFNESLDNTNVPADQVGNPTITFLPDVVTSSSLTFQSDSYSTTTLTNDTYIVTFAISDQDETQNDIDITVNASTDVAGNVQTSASTQNDVFILDTENPSATVTPSPDPVNNTDTGLDNFTLTVEYDEDMNTASTPVVAFSMGENPLTELQPGGNPVLSNPNGAWDIDNRTYVVTYDVADDAVSAATDGLELPNIDVQVTGAEDAVGNTQTTTNAADNFDIDNDEPDVNSLTPFASVSMSTIVRDADTGGNNFTLSIEFTEDMVTVGQDPVITFPTGGEDPSAVLTSESSSAWLGDNRTFVVTYTVSTADLTLADIDVRISGGQDVNGNSHVQTDIANVFSIDTQEPVVNSITIVEDIVDNDEFIVGERATVTIVFSESVVNFTVADLSETNGSFSSFGGSGDTYTVTYTPDDDIEGVTDQISIGTGYQDAFGNAGTASSSTVFDIDTREPTIISTEPIDSDEDGIVDQLTIIFSENVNVSDGGSASENDFILTSGSIAAGVYNVSNGTQVTYNLSGTPVDNTAILIDAEYDVAGDGNVRDVAGNEIEDGITGISVLDGAAPIIINAVTGDADVDGQIDRIVATFSEIIDETSVDGSDFSVDTYVVASASSSAGTNQATIVLNESGSGDTDITPEVGLLSSGNLADGSGNEIGLNQDFLGTTDGAAPAITDFLYQDADFNGNIDRFLISFSEPLAAGSNLSANDFTFTGGSVGDFAGAVFGGSTDNEVGIGGETNATVILGTPSTTDDTFDDSGSLRIVTQNGFSISDATGNTNNTLISQSQATYSDGAAPSITEVRFYDDASDDGLIDRLEFVFTENVLADDGSIANAATDELSAPDLFTLPDGSTADFSGASAGISANVLNVTGISGQIDPVTDASLIALDGFTVEFADAAGNTTVDPDNDFLNDNGFADLAAPVIVEVEFYDDDDFDISTVGDGLIERIVLFWSEPTIVSTAGGGTLDASDIASLTLPDGNAAIFSGDPGDYQVDTDGDGAFDQERMSIDGITGQVTQLTFDPDPGIMAITVNGGLFEDLLGNVATNPDQLQEFADRASPLFVAVYLYDVDTDSEGAENGDIDEVVFEMSEILDQSLVSGTDFTVSGVTSITPELSSANAQNPLDNADDDEFVTIRLEDYSGTATPATISYGGANNLADAFGNGAADFVSLQALAQDLARPVIVNITSSVSDLVTDIYGVGSLIDITLTMSENVNIGAPTVPFITLDTEPGPGTTNDADVNYVSGDGTNTFLFNYTVAAGQESPDPDFLQVIDFNAGTSVQDSEGNGIIESVDAVNTLGTNLRDNKSIIVDGVLPEILNAIFLDNDSDGSIDEIVIEVSEAVNETVLNGSDPLNGNQNVQDDFIIGGGLYSPTFLNSTSAINGDDDSDTDEFFTFSVDIPGTATTTIVYENNSTSLVDLIGNEADASSGNVAPDNILDEARPVVIESVTLDTDFNGDVDRVELELSENIQDSEFTGEVANFQLTPPGDFGSTQAMNAFDDEVTGAGGLGDFAGFSSDLDVDDDQYVSLTFTPASARGTGIATFEYVGTGVTDASGNQLFIPNGTALRDYAAPTVKNLAADLTPPDDDMTVESIGQISVQYSEEVYANGSNRVVFVEDETVPITTVYDANTNFDLVLDSLATGLVTIDLGQNLAPNRLFYVVMDAGAFRDAADNESADQFDSNDDWNFQTAEAVSIASTAFSGTSTISLFLNDDVALSNLDVSDFTVRDTFNPGSPFTVTNVSLGTGNTEIILTVDFSAAVGDVFVDFDGNVMPGSGTTQFAAQSFSDDLNDFMDLEIDTDFTAPQFSTVRDSSNSTFILFSFDEEVQLTGGINTADFTVTDGAGTDYVVSAVDDETSAAGVGSPVLTDNQILLTVADYSVAVGNITIDYASNGGITDYGSNQLASFSEAIVRDTEVPVLLSLNVQDANTLALQFEGFGGFAESVQIIDDSPASDFSVTDDLGNSYAVSAIFDDANTTDDMLFLSVQSVEDAIGDLRLEYSAAGTVIEDYGGNQLNSFTGFNQFTSNTDLNPVPSYVENTTNTNSGDTDGDVALYYKEEFTDVTTFRAQTPLEITPDLVGSTLTIYSDAGLTNQVAQQVDVGGANPSPWEPTLSDIFEVGPPFGRDFTDGTDDNGVYTFYITETSDITFTAGAEGEPLAYSIAILDTVFLTPDQPVYAPDDDKVDLEIRDINTSLYNVTYGNAAGVGYVDGPDGDGEFYPTIAGESTAPQLLLTIEEIATGTEARFVPFSITVTGSISVLEAGADVDFAVNEGEVFLEMNAAPDNTDIDGNETLTQIVRDFFGVEAYFVDNSGQIDNSIGTSNGITNSAGGLIENVLIYNPVAPAPLVPTPGVPSQITNGWSIDLTAFDTITDVRTLRLSLLISSDNANPLDSTGLATISTQDIQIFPVPVVDLDPFIEGTYCENDGVFTIRGDIFTFPNSDDNEEAVIIDQYEFWSSSDNGATYTKEADSTSAFFDPAWAGAGFYRIIYNTDPLTNAQVIGTDTVDFRVIEIAEPPRLLVENGSDLDVAGGLNLAMDKYVFEFCEGASIPEFQIDTANFEADGPNDLYNWYESLTDVGGSNVLVTPRLTTSQVTDIVGSFEVAGTRNLFVTRSLNGCESDAIEIEIRIFENPNEVVLEETDNVSNPRLTDPVDPGFDTGDYINVNESGEVYYFEYCGDPSATITFDQLVFASGESLTDPEGRPFIENRSYFKVYNENQVEIDSIRFGEVFEIAIGNIANNQTSATANEVIDTTFYITKVVADSTLFDNAALFTGCESDQTIVNVAIYTYPTLETSQFTGNPDLITEPGVVNYYMCQGEEFPDVGLTPPDVVQNETSFEWYAANSGNALTVFEDTIETTNRRGEVVSLRDLEEHGYFDNTVPGVYTYFVRSITNINSASGFLGCESGLQQVDITVFPSADLPTITLANDPNNELNNEFTNVGNFDLQYEFCVEAGTGLNPAVTFNSLVNFPQTPSSGQNEILWFSANDAGDGIANSNASATGASVTAEALRIQGEDDDTFNFAVIHQADFFDGFDSFDGCFSDTTFVRIVVSSIPAPQYTFQGLTINPSDHEDFGTTFDFQDPNNVSNPVRVDFEIRNVQTGDIVATYTNPSIDLSQVDNEFKHNFRDPGIYDGTLTVTSAAECPFTITRTFQILNIIEVADNRIFDFNDGNEGWFAEFRDQIGLSGSLGNPAISTSWEYGVPDGDNINSTASGAGAWATTGTTGALDRDGNPIENNYVGGEVSYVYSPAYNISDLRNPALRLSTFQDLDGLNDGVVLQYSVDDGLSWENVGSFDLSQPEATQSSGQNWYNASGINSQPGDDRVGGGAPPNGFNVNNAGWASSSDEEDWQQSTNSLVDVPISGRSNVRFRFALAAAGASVDVKGGGGFGFDNLEFFQLEKTVLIEQFTSSISRPSKFLDSEISNIFGDDEDALDETMLISYFTDLANGESARTNDPLNDRNTNGPGARTANYGINVAPTAVLDGEIFENDINSDEPTSSTLGFSRSDIDIKRLEPAEFTIVELNDVSADPSVVSVEAVIEANDTLINIDYTVIFAIVEKSIDVNDPNIVPSGEIGLYRADQNDLPLRNVLRVLRPTPAGVSLSENFVLPGRRFNYSMEWKINNVYDPTNLRVIMFIQDNVARDKTNNSTGLPPPNVNGVKRVLQSGFVDVVNANEAVLGIDGVSEFSVYPNPADDELRVEFEALLEVETNWVLYDQLGKEVMRGNLKRGAQSLSLITKEVSSGLYFFHLYRDEKETRAKRIIISH